MSKPVVVRMRGRSWTAVRPPADEAVRPHLEMFPPASSWTPPDFGNLPDVALVDHLGWDLETRDPDLKTKGPGWAWGNGTICGIAVWWGGGGGYYPLGHDAGGNLSGEDRATFERWASAVWRAKNVTLVMHNAMYDLGWMGTRPDTPRAALRANVFDTQSAAALLNEYRSSYSLDNVAKSELGRGKDERGLEEAAAAFGIDPKGELWKLPAAYVGPYAEADAQLTWELGEVFRAQIASRALTDIWELERALLVEVLWPMRERGVRVDVEAAEETVRSLHREGKALRKATLPAGVDVWGPDLGKWLAREGYAVPRTAAGAWSVTKGWLLEGAAKDPRLAALARIRRIDKLADTFVQAYLLDKHVDGRVYPQFHPLRSDDGGAVTGRFSSSYPNYQNLPAVRDENDVLDAGCLVRGMILPEPGHVWVAADYSQQEPRLAVHYAEMLALPGAAKLAEAYRADPKTDFYRLVAGTGLARKECKIVSLGRIYGMGDAKMCRDLGLPVVYSDDAGREVPGPEGRTMIDAFDRANPWMRALSRRVQSKVESVGYLRTIGGRRCRYRYDGTNEVCVDRGSSVSLHKFLNRLIQGGSADQTKTAMVAAARAGLGDYLRVTVHDELGWSVPDDAEVRDNIQRVMQTSLPLRVPVRAELKWGPSWGAARDGGSLVA